MPNYAIIQNECGEESEIDITDSFLKKQFYGWVSNNPDIKVLRYQDFSSRENAEFYEQCRIDAGGHPDQD